MARTGIVWDESLTGYDFGAGHPMNPLRLDLTAQLCREFGLLDHEGIALVDPDIPQDELLRSVHTPQYIDAVKQASAHPSGHRAPSGWAPTMILPSPGSTRSVPGSRPERWRWPGASGRGTTGMA